MCTVGVATKLCENTVLTVPENCAFSQGFLMLKNNITVWAHLSNNTKFCSSEVYGIIIDSWKFGGVMKVGPVFILAKLDQNKLKKGNFGNTL